jgi:uncharacterized glyoxalase superfamily protein PhnB
VSAFEALCRLLGLLPERVHILGYETVQSPGITSRWMQDLEPVGGRQLVSGELVELVSTLDPALAFSAAPNARFEILEQDHLLTGFQDDPIVALIGTGAADPEDGFQAVPRETVFAFMEPGQTLAEHVEAYRREHPDDYDTRLLALTDVDAMVSHVVTWWRARRLEDFLDSEFYFVLDLDGTRDGTDRILDVAVGPSGVPVRLTGTVVDANPLDPAAPEAVPAAQVKLARRTARTGDDGSYVLDARLRMGANPLEVDRPGVERTVVTAEVAQATGGSVTVTVKDAAGATLGTATTAGAPDMSTALALALDPIAVVVHKIRGTVTWPDSRDDAPGYAGTPLQQRRVYALPLAPGPTVPQRPRHTSDWSRLKHDPRVLRSTRPGRYAHDEPTAADGAWEIRFVDLSLGAAHLVWTESPDPDEPGGSSPDYLVRTFHASLTWLTGPETTLAAAAGPGGNQMTLANAALFAAGQRVVVGDDDAQEGARIQNIAGNVVTVQTEAATGNFARAHAAGGSVSLAAGDASRRASRGHHLIDHTFNLLRAAAADRTAWGLDVIRVVDWEADPSHPDPGTTDPRMIRPARGADPAAFDEAVIGTGSTVEQLTFDPARRLATDVRLHSVPLVPRAEPVDRQSPAARRAAAGLEAAADAQFPRGHLTQHVPFVLDARRIDSGIDLVNPPPPAWDPTPATGDDELRARRRCELLEHTHVVTPQLPGRVFDPPAPPSGVTDVYWYSDAISLADGAWIQIPDPAPAPARAVIANRYLESNWVAVIEPVLPRLVALAANRTLMLAPGHGLYADPGTASDAPADRFRWESQRGGWHWRAGEDDNDVLMAREVDRVAVANGLAVENVREVRDLVRIGVTHTGVDRWTASGRIDFLRLWQQNPVYYLGHVRDPPLPARASQRCWRPTARSTSCSRSTRTRSEGAAASWSTST